MKALPFTIPKPGNPAVLVQVDDGAHFYDILHKHKEHQITLILKGEGTLICSEYLGRFAPGDLFVIGSNQPHVLRCDEEYYDKDREREVLAISVFFQDDSLGAKFMELTETKKLKTFINRVSDGMRFSPLIAGQTIPYLKEAKEKEGLELVIIFLQILNILMQDEQTQPFSHLSKTPMNENEGQRMNAVVQHTLRYFRESISIESIARVANMSPNAFCRYFKQRTRKTYLNYLNEIRIAYACRQLQKTHLTVSQAAQASGFNNLSHFNRSFKKVVGLTPARYGRDYNLNRK